jgi:hypothetical protein
LLPLYFLYIRFRPVKNWSFSQTRCAVPKEELHTHQNSKEIMDKDPSGYGTVERLLAKLPRRPAHMSAAEHMQMEMVHSLAAIGTGIDDNAIAFGQAFVACDLRGGKQQMA